MTSSAANSSFSTNFWGKDDRGAEVIIGKMNQGSQTMEELLSFFRERIAIEEDYSRRMMSLSKKFNITGIYETGHLNTTFQVLKSETEAISKSHLNESRKLKFNVYDKTEIFLSNFNGKKKQIESSVENLMSTKKMLLQNVLKLKERYQTETSKLNSYVAAENLLLGKELDQNREKIYKQQQVVSEIRSEYQLNCAKLEELNTYWISDWKNSSSILQSMEAERIDFLVKQLWEYSNLISMSCVNDDTSCENLRKELELCDPGQEISHFVKKFQTGSQIYPTPKFVDFINNGGIEEDIPTGGFSNETRSTSASTRHSTNPLHPMQHQQQQQQQKPLPPQLHPTRSLDPGPQHHPRQQHLNNVERAMNINHPVSNLQRRAPPSEDGQTSISNPSTHFSSNPSTALNSEESAYSNPTSISIYPANAIDHELRSSQNWNSPSRRRSRNSDILSVVSKKPSILSNRKSFILDSATTSTANSRDGSSNATEFVDLRNEDPLRATLEDLKIGGNGDMKKFKEYITHNKSNASSLQYQARPVDDESQFRSSVSSNKTNNTVVMRPKSMIVPDSEPMISPVKNQQGSSIKRSSFHAGLRNSSKSSINIQAKLQPNGLPSVTLTGKRILKHVKALFDFNAQIDGELSFKEGDVLYVIHMQVDGWWECENSRTGESGLAPYNYVEQI